jgi:hypothetical protein
MAHWPSSAGPCGPFCTTPLGSPLTQTLGFTDSPQLVFAGFGSTPHPSKYTSGIPLAIRQLSLSTVRRLSLVLLWLVIPALVVFTALLAEMTLRQGGLNVHGGAGYGLLLLSVLTILAAMAITVIAPILLLQIRSGNSAGRAPICKKALLVSGAFLACSFLVTLSLWLQATRQQ